MSVLIPLPKSFVEKILKPVNRLTESCVLKADKNSIYSICSSPNSTVILYAKATLPFEVTEAVRLNLINIKKLLSGLECLGDDGVFTIEYNGNNIKCENKTDDGEKTFFKYHLVDDSVIRETPVNIEKIAALKFDTDFNITTSKVKQIMAGYSFASDLTNSKIYFYTKEGKVYAEINDRTQQNVDNMTLLVSSDFTGEEIPNAIAINAEVFKNLASCKTDIKVKINNQFKVFVFQNKEEDDVELKYIISALVK